MADDTVIQLIKQMERANILRFANLERQRAELHKENLGRFSEIEGQLNVLNSAFHQAKGGIKVLYWLGGLLVGLTTIAEVIWHWKNQ